MEPYNNPLNDTSMGPVDIRLDEDGYVIPQYLPGTDTLNPQWVEASGTESPQEEPLFTNPWTVDTTPDRTRVLKVTFHQELRFPE